MSNRPRRLTPRVRRVLVLAAAAAPLATGCWIQPALGSDLVMVFDAAGSVNPASDPSGAQLQAIMSHVESVYQDIFEDAHTLTITFRYGNQPAGTLAAHSLTAQAGGRETAGTIVFDPDASGSNWFFDPTPADNSEFNMT